MRYPIGGYIDRVPHPTPVIRSKTHAGRISAYVVRWNRKDFYLSADPAEANRLFYADDSTHPGSLKAWRTWRATRPSTQRASSLANSRKGPALVIVSAEFLLTFADEGRDSTREFFRKHLARFIKVHGRTPLLSLAMPNTRAHVFTAPVVPLLEALKRDMQTARLRKKKLDPSTGRATVVTRTGYKADTIKNDMIAVKRLFNWAHAMGRCPAISWKGVKAPARRRPEIIPYTPAQLFDAMRIIHASRPELLPYVALTYLCCLRPSEVLTLVADARPAEIATFPEGFHRIKPARALADHERGRFEPVRDEHGSVVDPRGLFLLRRHKNSWRYDTDPPPRVVVLTPQAQCWLDAAAPIWTTLSAFSRALRACGAPVRPKRLQKTGASHLLARGVGEEDVDRLLGHARPGELPSYALPAWHALYLKAGRISL